MSHFTSIQTRVRDLEAPRDACDELGLEFKSKTPSRGYAHQTRNRDHTIVLKGPHDIAVDPPEAKEGGDGLTSDWCGTAISPRESGPATVACSDPSPHFSHPFYCGLFFPVVAALRLLAPRAVCSHTALRPSPRAPCHTGKSLRLVTKSVRNAG